MSEWEEFAPSRLRLPRLMKARRTPSQTFGGKIRISASYSADSVPNLDIGTVLNHFAAMLYRLSVGQASRCLSALLDSGEKSEANRQTTAKFNAAIS
jgi:hypothetical protein